MKNLIIKALLVSLLIPILVLGWGCETSHNPYETYKEGEEIVTGKVLAIVHSNLEFYYVTFQTQTGTKIVEIDDLFTYRLVVGQYYTLLNTSSSKTDMLLLSTNLTPFPTIIKGNIIHISNLQERTALFGIPLSSFRLVTLSNNVTYWVYSGFKFPLLIDDVYEFTTTPSGEIIGYR